ncbi:MAG: GGDEF domain-containing protein [Pseudomonadota bacterium]
MFQNLLNGLLLCIVQSLALNKSMFYILFKDMAFFYLSTLIMTLMLVYNYYYIGIWAVIGIYFIFAMAQSSMQLAVDNRMKAEKLYKDNLTGTFNREYFIKTIETRLRTKKQFSIIFLDMDNFKQINDEFGHLVGDKALQEFAAGMKGILRKEDFLYRYGGDEFAIIAADKAAAGVIGRKLYENKISLELEVGSIDIRFSTGIYHCTGTEESCDIILARVDAAMYAAKQKGGHQIVHVEC